VIARLTRPHADSPQDERRAYLQRLAQTLDDLGVEPGDEFMLGNARPGGDAAMILRHDENRQGAVRRDAGVTSRKAASAVAPRTGTQRHRVLEHVAWATNFDGLNGTTRDELSSALAMTMNSVLPRTKELLDGGWVEETDRTRKTRNGHDAAVLVVTDKGRKALAEVS
jgi:hypothetical protein